MALLKVKGNNFTKIEVGDSPISKSGFGHSLFLSDS